MKKRARSASWQPAMTKTSKPRLNVKWVIGIGLLIGTIIALSIAGIRASHQARQEVIHKKALALGLFGASSEIEERHVWISEHPQVPGKNGEIPVHIMFRKNNYDSWELCGTGAILGGKYTNWVLTAYHLFEGSPGQYGCRKIGTNEFTGNEPVIPIVSVDSSKSADDAVTCTINPSDSGFPVISVPVSTNMFSGYGKNEGKTYEGDTWPAKIHFSTYPEKIIQGLMMMKFGNAYHGVFDWNVFPGESGTVASVESENANTYLVIIRHHRLTKEIIDQLNPENRKRFNWSESKLYGVGNLIKLD